MPEIMDDDVVNVLQQDGVKNVFIEKKFENISSQNLIELAQKLGSQSWAVRLVYNNRFGGVLIQQQPEEGNRLHYHPDADECWVIIKGEWEWFIEGQGTRTVREGDLVIVPEKVKHKITCKGKSPGIRFAITAPDVKHVYAKE